MNMEMKQQRFVFRIIYKRIMYFIAIILLISIFFGVLVFVRSQSYYSDIIYKKQVERLNFVNGNFEKEVDTIKRIQYNVMMNENINNIRFFYESSSVYDRYQMIQAVMDDMESIRNSSRWVSDAKIYFSNIQRVISAEEVDTMNPSEFEEIQQEYMQSTAPLVHYKKSFQMMEAHTDYLMSTIQVPDCLLIVELDKRAIDGQLKFAQLTDRDIVVLADQNTGTVISSTNPSFAADSRMSFHDGIRIGDSRYRVIRSTSQLLKSEMYWLYVDNTDSVLTSAGWLIFFAFLAIMGIVLVSGFFVSYKGAYHPLKVLLEDAFWQVSRGNFKYRIRINERTPFAYLYQCFNDMVGRIDLLVEKDLKQQLLLSHAQLKQLQAQINPHFMYNSYYVLYRMIKMRDLDNSVKFCEHLGKFYEYITRDGEDEKMLSDEVEHGRVYASIQSYRFRDRVRIEFEPLPAHWAAMPIPRLILQPLLENVFQYVFEKETADQAGLLRVSFHEGPESRIIRVENSGDVSGELIAKIREVLENGNPSGQVTALANIHKRLGIFFDQRAGLNISRSEWGGLCVDIYLPNGEESGHDDEPL